MTKNTLAILFGLFSLLSFNSFAQNPGNDAMKDTANAILPEGAIRIYSVGSGADSISSRNNAIFSALEKAYINFISSDRSMLANELISNDIIRLSAGNILSFVVENEIKLPNENWISSLNVVLSLSNLKKYVVNKGYTLEFGDGLFGQKLKLQKLYLSNEVQSLSNLLPGCAILLENAVDYSLSTSDLKKSELTKQEDEYEVELNVTCTLNENVNKFNTLLYQSLIKLQMTENEVKEYKEMNKTFYSFTISNPLKGAKQIFYLRSFESYRMFEDFFLRTNTFLSNFEIRSNLESMYMNKDFFENYIPSMSRADWDGNTSNCINCYNFGTKQRLWSYETHMSFPDVYVSVPNWEDVWYPLYYVFSDLMNSMKEEDKDLLLSKDNLLVDFYRKDPYNQNRDDSKIYIDANSYGVDAMYKLESSNGILYVANFKGDQYFHKIRYIRKQEFLEKIQKIEIVPIKNM